MQLGEQSRFGVIRAIAWIYLALGLALVVASVLHVQFAGQRLGLLSAILPALLVLGAIGTLLKRRWGRYLSGFFSIILLIGVPIGTFLGGFMLYQLIHNKDLFTGAGRVR